MQSLDLVPLFAAMRIGKRLGVDLSGDLDVLVPRLRDAIAAWRERDGAAVVDSAIAQARKEEAEAQAARAAADEAERRRLDAAHRWELFDGATSVVERHAAALDRALQEASDHRRLLSEACALATARFPGASGMVAFLEPRDAQRVIERAVLQAGAGVAPESVAASIRGGLETLAKVRAAAGSA